MRPITSNIYLFQSFSLRQHRLIIADFFLRPAGWKSTPNMMPKCQHAMNNWPKNKHKIVFVVGQLLQVATTDLRAVTERDVADLNECLKWSDTASRHTGGRVYRNERELKKQHGTVPCH